MKKLLSTAFLLIALTTGLIAQTSKSVDGIWLGTLKVQTAELRLGFTFSGAEEGNLSAIMTSIDQGGVEVPMDVVTLKGDSLVVKHPPIMMEIEGKIDPVKGTWDCEFSQASVTAPILFKKVEHLPGTE